MRWYRSSGISGARPEYSIKWKKKRFNTVISLKFKPPYGKRRNKKHTMSLQDTQYLAPGDALHLGNAVRITKDDTNLRGSQTLLGKLADVLINLKGGIQYKFITKPQ